MTLKVHCPECRGQFQVDGEESRTRFDCPFCSAPFRFQDKQTVVLSSSPLTQVQVERLETPVGPLAMGGSAAPLDEGSMPKAPDPAPIAPGAPPTGDRNDAPTPPHRHPSQSKPLHAAVPTPEDLTPLRPGDVINGYRLEEVIGWGGMSVVFRAQQLSLGRNVALKVMRHELGEDPEFSRRFLNEARALAELSHANIVQVIDQGIHEGNHYLVMEYIDGVSLREVLSERRLSPVEALHFVPELCAALEYAHERGIIHRDIKPENIMVTKTGVPKIADFGLVRMMGKDAEEFSRITQTRTILGTIDYMAPEQREGQSDVDHRADIYSLGVVLYEMLTGELPIARFPLPSERVKIDVRIDDVVLKVLQKDRDLRYQSASMIASDLDTIDRAPAPRRRHLFGASRAPSAPTPPSTITGQVLSLFWFPLVVAFFAAAADDEVALAATGAAIPWLMLQARSYGWLRPIPPWLLGRRRFLFFFALGLFALMKNDVLEEEPGILAVAFCLSAAFALKRPTWEEDAEISTGFFRKSSPGGNLTRNSGASPHPSRGDMATATSATHGSSSVVSPFSTDSFSTDSGSTDSAFAATIASPPPLPSAYSHKDEPPIVSAPFTEKDETMTPHSPTVTAVDREAERRARLSPMLLLAFIFTLGTLLYSAGVSVPLLVAGSDWQETALDISFEYHDVQNFVAEVAPFSPEAVRPMARMGRAMMFIPFGVPLLLALIALPGILQRRRRGFATMAVVFGLLGAEISVLAASTTPVIRTIERYCDTYSSASGDANSLLIDSEEWDDPVTRLALLHRSAGETSAEAGDIDAGAPLVRAALNSGLTQLERMVALSVLEQNYRHQLKSTEAFPSVPEWQTRFAQLADTDSRLRPQLREGFVAVLRHVPSPELAGIFADYLDRQYNPERIYALQWWLEVAPDDTFDQWIDSLRTHGCSSSLSQLVSSSPARVRGTPRGVRLHEAVVH